MCDVSGVTSCTYVHLVGGRQQMAHSGGVCRGTRAYTALGGAQPSTAVFNGPNKREMQLFHFQKRLIKRQLTVP